jgi:putative hemolysin
MTPLWADTLAIFLLILFNAFLAAAELSVISLRLSRVQQLSGDGTPDSRALLKLRKDPERFVATVQVMMTLSTGLASAATGTVSYEKFKPILAEIPGISSHHIFLPLSVFGVILLQVFGMLVLGEIVPKTIAIRNNERIALRLSRPILLLSELLVMPVRVVTATSLFVVRLLKVTPTTASYPITPEELELLLKEGGEHGIINRTEQDLIQSVFKFTDISVREVMVPRVRMVTLRTGMSLSEIIAIFSENRYSRYPVLREEGEEVAGILYYKDLVELLNASPGGFKIEKVLHSPYFVPESMKVPHVLKEMQKRRTQMALVLDEYGALDGLVTMEDLLEEIVGEIEDESDEVSKPVERLRDGSCLVDASLSIRDLSEDYRIPIPEGEDYETLAGFVLSQLQTIPRGGEFFFAKNMKITVVEVDRQRVSRVRIEFLDAPSRSGATDSSISSGSSPSAVSSTPPGDSRP